MPAERIAENLAFINWTVLLALAAGSIAAVTLAVARTDATRGFLAFSAATAVAFGILGALSDGGLPVAGGSSAGGGSAWAGDVATLEAIRRAALWVGAAGAGILTIHLARGGRSARLGLIALLPFGAAGIAGAAAWTADPLAAALLLGQLGVLAAATGGAWVAMVLGHWYLVTPKLPTQPLVLVARVLLAVVTLQAGLFVVWTGLGAGPAGRPAFAALTGEWAMFVWLRLLVGLAFPVAVSWAAVQTARTRSMESATGLLYIDLGTIAVGTILAAGLYFGAGILV